jgi:hypothetical protein
VAWKMLNFPKKERGLGIKKLEEWNRAAIMKHIWSLFAKARSLWVTWVNENLLMGRSFWPIKVPQSCSWYWRKLLKLRVEANNFLRFDVGNGINIHLWTNWWHPVVYRAIYDSQSHLNSRLSSVIRDGLWFWKPARSDALVEIQSKLFMVDFGVGHEPKWVIS